MATAEQEAVAEQDDAVCYEDLEQLQQMGVNAQDVRRLKESGQSQYSTHCTHTVRDGRSLCTRASATCAAPCCRHPHHTGAVHGDEEGTQRASHSLPRIDAAALVSAVHMLLVS